MGIVVTVDGKRKRVLPKQEMFCQAYCATLNGAESARRAGYPKKNARNLASQLLACLHIQVRINQLRENVAGKFNITREGIIQQYARLAYSDSRKLYTEHGAIKPIHEIDDDTAAAINSVEVDSVKLEGVEIGKTTKLKMATKREALDSLCKVLGFFAPEKIDNNVNITQPLTDAQVDKILMSIPELIAAQQTKSA